MYGFLKYKVGDMEGLMNPQNPKILSDLPNKLLTDVQTLQEMFPHPLFVRN